MVRQVIQIICVVFIALYSHQIHSASKDITLNELVLGGQEEFHLRILKAIPKNGQISIGPEDAKNTIIEFFDYKCGYCVKMHPELVELAEKRNDTRVVFLQLPILSEMSVKISKMVLAANYQNKGYDLHHALFTKKGAITVEKIGNILQELNIDTELMREDLKRTEIDESLKLTSFIANSIGARGTPAVFINDNFNPGYVPKKTIEKILK